MPKKLDQVVVDEVLRLYKDGHSIQAVANMAGVCPASVVQYLRKNYLTGIRPRVTNSEKQKKMLELYSSGLSAAECGRRLECKTETVLKYLRHHGIEPKASDYWSQGSRNPAWVGGRCVSRGYIYLKCEGHPYANSGGYVREHRLVMEKYIGRYLLPSEVVHHKDKNTQNNHISNLQLFSSNGEHLAEELKGHVPKWTEDGKRRIREGHPSRRARAHTPNHSKKHVQQLRLFHDQS